MNPGVKISFFGLVIDLDVFAKSGKQKTKHGNGNPRDPLRQVCKKERK